MRISILTKTIISLSIILLTIFLFSCDEKQSTAKEEILKQVNFSITKVEESPEIIYANYLCDCFENLDTTDFNSQLYAVDCLLKMHKDTVISLADENVTLLELKNLCPKGYENYMELHEK